MHRIALAITHFHNMHFFAKNDYALRVCLAPVPSCLINTNYPSYRCQSVFNEENQTCRVRFLRKIRSYERHIDLTFFRTCQKTFKRAQFTLNLCSNTPQTCSNTFKDPQFSCVSIFAFKLFTFNHLHIFFSKVLKTRCPILP
jgi:hypothetical protein